MLAQLPEHVAMGQLVLCNMMDMQQVNMANMKTLFPAGSCTVVSQSVQLPQLFAEAAGLLYRHGPAAGIIAPWVKPSIHQCGRDVRAGTN